MQARIFEPFSSESPHKSKVHFCIAERLEFIM